VGCAYWASLIRAWKLVDSLDSWVKKRMLRKGEEKMMMVGSLVMVIDKQDEAS